MKSATLFKGLTFGVLLASSSLFSGATFAAANDGVRCPSGYTTSFAGGIMKCSRQTQTVAETRNTACPAFGIGYEYVRRTGAFDFCRRFSDGESIAVVPDGVPFVDPQNWQLKQDGAGSGKDLWIKPGVTSTDYAYPQAVNLL